MPDSPTTQAAQICADELLEIREQLKIEIRRPLIAGADLLRRLADDRDAAKARTDILGIELTKAHRDAMTSIGDRAEILDRLRDALDAFYMGDNPEVLDVTVSAILSDFDHPCGAQFDTGHGVILQCERRMGSRNADGTTEHGDDSWTLPSDWHAVCIAAGPPTEAVTYWR